MMVDAKDYPNTVELVAEVYYNYLRHKNASLLKDIEELTGEQFCQSEYRLRPDAEKETYREIVSVILNTVNYFEGKTCKDCDYFENVACITPEGDYSEDPYRKICTNFAPKGLVGTQAGC